VTATVSIAIPDMDALHIEGAKGVIAARIGIKATLYFLNSGQADQRKRIGMAAMQVIAAWAPCLRWALPPNGNLASASTVLPRLDLANVLAQSNPRTQTSFFAHSGETKDDAGVASVSLHLPRSTRTPALGFLSFSLGVGQLATLPDGAILPMVMSICELVQPFHGSCGLGLVLSPDPYVARRADPYLLTFLDRFPGLEFDHPITDALRVLDGIKGVNWLTILGPEQIERFGGANQLQTEAAAQGLLVRPFSGGAIVQAGPAPNPGDKENGLVPEPYKRANLVLAKLRSPCTGITFNMDSAGIDSEAFTRQWLDRFD